PPLGELIVPADRAAVDVLAQRGDGKRRVKGGAERPPAGHHLPHVLLAPQTEAEAVLARRDPGDEAESFAPFAQLHPGHRRIADLPLAQGRGGRGGTGGRELGQVRPGVPPVPPLPPLPPLPPSSILSICAPSARSRSSMRS